MGGLRQRIVRDATRDTTFMLFLVALVLSLVRARDQPGLDVTVGSETITVIPADLALVALGISVAVRCGRRRSYPRPAVPLTAAALVFAGLVVATAVVNGGTAFVAAGKLVELATLMIGGIVLVDSVERLWAVVGVLVAVAVVGAVWAVVGFVERPGERQPAFLGEHDLSVLSTAVLVIGLAALYARHGLGRIPTIAALAGAVGVTLGSSMASLLGLYLATAVLVAVAAARKSLRRRALVITVLVILAVTGGTYSMRSADLGFLRQWFAPSENASPGEYAAGWSQRLIYSYMGMRIFIDRPLAGTGWWGELPPPEYVRYLPDAHRRFPDEPAHYFPPADGTFIPQQTYDQILYQLGLLGATSFLALAGLAVRDARRPVRRWPSDDGDELAAYLPAVWSAALAGALAGSALFGGTPIASIFWITLGLIGAVGVLSASRRAEAAA